MLEMLYSSSYQISWYANDMPLLWGHGFGMPLSSLHIESWSDKYCIANRVLIGLFVKIISTVQFINFTWFVLVVKFYTVELYIFKSYIVKSYILSYDKKPWDGTCDYHVIMDILTRRVLYFNWSNRKNLTYGKDTPFTSL